MKNTLLFYLLSVVILTFACSKDETEEENGPVQLLKSIYYDDILSQEFEYDDQDRISKIIFYSHITGEESSQEHLTYDENGDLTEVNYLNSLTNSRLKFYAFQKKDNKITVNDYLFFNNNDYLLLNDDGLLIESFQDLSSETWTMFYRYDADGNISNLTQIIDREGTDNDITYEYLYVYDKNKSPFYSCKTPQWFLTRYYRDFSLKNNRIGRLVNDNSTPSSYTYDEAGYAITEKVGIVQYTYLYIQK